MSDNDRCSASVLRFGWPQDCLNPSKVVRDGKPYCGIHDPVMVAERRAKADAAYAEKMAAEDRKWAERRERDRRADLFPEMLEALKVICTAAEGTDRELPHLLADAVRLQGWPIILKAEKIDE